MYYKDMGTVTNLLSKIDVGSITGLGSILRDPNGLFALLALVVFSLYGLSVGKSKALVSLLSIYVAYLLTVLFPFLSWLQRQIIMPSEAPVLNALVFAVFYIITFMLLSHSMMRHRLTLGEISLSKVIIISIVQLGLLSSVTISLVPAEFGTKTFGFAYPYLAGQRMLWIWAVASLLILPFMRSSARR